MNLKELDPSASPWAAFGVQLRRSRQAANVTQAELGKLVSYGASYVSYVELAQRPPSARFARLVDEALGTGGTLSLMWWQQRNTALLEGFPEYAADEAKAAEIRLFELGVIPGLVQTKEYATALVAAAVGRGNITPGQAEERLAFLATRQSLLERNPAPIVHAVLDESCLRRSIGGREVMARQLDHLQSLAGRPNVIVQVAPYDLGERRPFALPVTLLTLADRSVLGYTESQQRGFLERETETVTGWERNYDRLQVEALSQADSLSMIRAIRKELL
ncbi:helix-turn-helix domain-containing protein [Kitasatospora herbaricolor]|uniref:helix-turn-helix domain-containing protein n=1 Tax=Kitasatospora herbaricolor TaxID=68217 RepID=UPI0036D976C8